MRAREACEDRLAQVQMWGREGADDAPAIVLCSFIPPFRAERRRVRAGGRGRVLRDLHRHAARGMYSPRCEGPLCQGASWHDQELHGLRFTLRAAAGARACARHYDGSPEELAECVVAYLKIAERIELLMHDFLGDKPTHPCLTGP